MRDYGKVTTDIWMQQDMGFMEKLLLAYLHSGPHTNWIGCFYCPEGYAAEDLDVPVSRVRKAFAALAEKSFIRRNGKMVFLPGFIALNPVENGNTATARIKTFMTLPAGDHKTWVAAEMLQHLRHLSDEQRALLDVFVAGNIDVTACQTAHETVTGTVRQTVTGTIRGIEKEKEKEKEDTNTHTPSQDETAAQDATPIVCVDPPVGLVAEPKENPRVSVATPEKPPPDPEFPYGDPRPAGKLAKLLRGFGVQVSPQNPDFCQWVENGLDTEELTAGVEIARVAKPKPEPIPWAYLAKVLTSQRKVPSGHIPVKPRDAPSPWEIAI